MAFVKRGVRRIFTPNSAAEFVKSAQMTDEIGSALATPTRFRDAQDQFVDADQYVV
jgi:hypothetical protein